MKRILSVGLRLCVLIGLMSFLIYFGFIDLSVLFRLLWHPEVLILGAGAIFASYATGALRWWLLLRAQGLELDYLHTFQLYAISNFSSIFIPGGTGSSDAVRLLMLMHTLPGYRGQALFSVFGDRFIAVFVLATMIAILTLVQWPLTARSAPIFWLSIWSLVLPVALMLIVLAGWVIMRKAKGRIEEGSISRRWLVRIVAVTSNFLDLALDQWPNILAAMTASAATTALSLFSIVIVSTAASFPSLSQLEIAHAAALSLFANGLPISPGGIGVGEAAFNQICIWIGEDSQFYPYATIFLGYRILGIIVACYGGVALLQIQHLTKSIKTQSCPSANPQVATPTVGPG